MEFQNLPIHLPGCHINQVAVVGQIIYIQATTEDREAKCPICCSVSNRIHGYYCRKLTDLPISECQVIIHLKVRRYSCINQECRRKTFSQPLGQLFQSHQRATFRLHRALYHIAQFLGGQAGARLAGKLNMPTSGRTLLRIVRQYPLALEVMPRIVGVDDWAMRRGHTYGTILVDLERHRVIDVLPGRSANGLANWLTQQPDITIVARDRSKEYAAGIVTGAPNAIQIADRWHLLKNLRDTVDSSLNELYPHLKKRLNTHAHEDTPGKPALRSAFLRGKPDKLAHQARRIQQMKRYELVQYLKHKGFSIRNISDMLSMHRVAVTRFYKAESFPEQKHRKMKPSILDPYLPYLETRVQEGCNNSAQLWQEIVSQGYQGSQSQVSKWMTWRRRQPQEERQVQMSANNITPVYHLPSARILAQILFAQPEALNNDNDWLLGRLIKIPEINTLYDLIQRFIIMVKERRWEYLDGWLHDCHFSSLPAFKRFAQSITQDYEAVRAALLYEWSNGQTEGQINRLKYLKRQMYGRANLDLLKLRVMYAP